MAAVFVGRDRERAELLAGLEGAAAGRGGVFLVAGEPGIGKTALAEHVANHAAERGARVLWGRSWEGDAEAPYWMWAQIVRGLVEGLEDETRQSLRSPATAYLALLVPELADHFGDAAKPAQAPDFQAARFYLFEATARFLKQASSIQPLVLILDDLLAGDHSSLLLLRYLARDLRGSRLLVVATYRDIEATRSPETTETLADLLRDANLIALRALEREEVRDLITEISGVVPWKEKAAAIHDATAGNPLFVREITRLLTSRDALDQPGALSIPVPGSVQAVIRRRLAPLSADAVQVLSAAAVVGRDFDLVLVGAASELPTQRVLDSITEAVTLGVVTEADAAGLFRFYHPLMRLAIYEGLPLAARTQMHGRVANAIERLRGDESPSHLGELAHHFARVAALGESSKACDYARRAGDHAMKSFAYEDAIVQYRRALDALAIGETPDPLLRCELLLSLGQAQARAGEYPAAKATFLLAADMARMFGQAEHLAGAALGMGEQLIEAGRPDRQLLTLLEEALDRLGPDDSVFRARLQARLSLELTFADGTRGKARRDALSQEALQIARRSGDPSALVDALRARWMALWGPDGLAERSTLAEELLALAHESGDRWTELIGRAQRATCSLQSGEMTAVDADVVIHARLAEELRMPYFEWAAATMQAAGALLTGSLETVETLAQKAFDHLPGRSNAALAYLNQLSTLRWEQGRLGELREEWAQVVERAPQMGLPRGWLCLATTQLGEEDAARASLREMVGTTPGLPRDGLWLPTMAIASLSAAELEDRDAAAVLYPLLSPYAKQVVVLPMLHPALCLGAVPFYLGLLATTGGDWEEAERHFEAALRVNTRLGARPLLARTHAEYASMLIGRGGAADHDRVGNHLARAAALADDLGLSHVAQRVETLGARPEIGNLPSPAVSKSRDSPHSVEPRRALPLAEVPATDVFRLEGAFWTIVHDGRTVRLADSKGLRCLARLLARPGEEILALDLELTDGQDPPAAPAATRRAVDMEELEMRTDLGDAGEMLDAQARAAYKARLEVLQDELEEAERFNDAGRAQRAREEREFLARELARAVGIGGHGRRAASHAERARLNVTRAIRSAMQNLARVHPPLAEHLVLTIRTGRYCSYTPDPRAPIRWQS